MYRAPHRSLPTWQQTAFFVGIVTLFPHNLARLIMKCDCAGQAGDSITSSTSPALLLETIRQRSSTLPPWCWGWCWCWGWSYGKWLFPFNTSKASNRGHRWHHRWLLHWWHHRQLLHQWHHRGLAVLRAAFLIICTLLQNYLINNGMFACSS